MKNYITPELTLNNIPNISTLTAKLSDTQLGVGGEEEL